MSVNDIDHESQKITVMDVFDYFDEAKRKGEMFDLVILDPPSYARSKKVTFSVAKDYAGLIERALDLTHDDGVIVASTNHSGLTREKFFAMIEKGFKSKGERVELLESFGLPKDFVKHPQLTESDYLKVFFVRRKKS
jgi:23S rRNA (cytosine1962-C5)-methyltransferase